MKLSDFSYELPQELIAQHPAEPRDTARLMLYDKKTGETENKIFRQLTDELHQGDVLVFNDSKVIPARLHGTRVPTGGKVEVLLLTPVGEDRWEVLVKPGKKALPGATLSFGERLTGVVEDRTDYGGRVIHFTYDGVFDHIIEEIGEMPLPPYIHEKPENTVLSSIFSSSTGRKVPSPTCKVTKTVSTPLSLIFSNSSSVK